MNPAPLIYVSTGILILLYIMWRTGYFHLAMYRRALGESLLDFLLTLQVFEANGMGLPSLFEAAGKGLVGLPKPYLRLSRIYGGLCRVIHEPYSCIRRLADLTPHGRLADFLRGYSEIAVSTGETLHYVESAVGREVERINGELNNTLSMVDSIFEGLLIIILSILIYDYLPLGGITPLVIPLTLMPTGIVGYVILMGATGRLMWPGSRVIIGLSILVIVIASLAALLDPGFTLILFLAYAFATIISAAVYRRLLSLETSILNLLEEIYVGARQGLPVDHVLIESHSWGLPNIARRMLSLGYSNTTIMRILRLPPLPQRMLSLVLAPLAVGSLDAKHVGVVLRFTGIIRGLRERLRSRGRLYYVYTLTLPVVLLAFAHSLAGMGGENKLPIVGVGVASTIIAFIMAGLATSGCGICNYKNIVLAAIIYTILVFLSP
jgi:flagellar protein FlaJ